MPTFPQVKQPKPIEIDQWFGVNESIGQTELNPGEALEMVNFKLTENRKLSKRKGRKDFCNFEIDLPVRVLWAGNLKGAKILAVVNSKLYNVISGTPELIGSFGGDYPTTTFFFGNKLYFLNGVEYKVYDGTTFSDVAPYVPLVVTGATPNLSASTTNEKINLLTGKKKIQYVADGTTAYKLPESNISADVLIVKVDGVLKVEVTDFTVNRTDGTFEFKTAPVAKSFVEAQWNKTSTDNENLVKNNRFATIYGVSNDTTVFMWGNVNKRNRRIFSGIGDIGEANYFPVTNYTNIGQEDYAITDIKTVYDRQIIFKEDQTFYSVAELNALTNLFDYPVRPLNYAVGNETYGGVQILNNDPYTLYADAVYSWANTAVKDERNAVPISDKMAITLSNTDFKSCITFDNQNESELWINYLDKVIIYNYELKAWYTYSNIEANCFLSYDNQLYYGDKHGKIKKFGNFYADDVYTPIACKLKSGFIDFGVPYLNKSTRNVWAAINPASYTSAKVSFATDRDNVETASESVVLEYALFDWNFIDFNNFSFSTNRNPQVKMVKAKVKKYAYLQYIIENDELDQPLDFISMILKCETAGIHK